MGNSNNSSEARHRRLIEGFDIGKYRVLRPVLSQDEVLELLGIFEDLGPQEGLIKVSEISRLFQHVEKASVQKKFGYRDKIDFESFFVVMADELIEKKRNLKSTDSIENVDFESNIKDVSCFLWPYPSQKKRINRDSLTEEFPK